MPPSSNPPPPSAPGSTPPGASTPASADTINQALDAVKAAFPAGSSALVDLRLDASDDDTASITVVITDADPCTGIDVAPIMTEIVNQFQASGIPQDPLVTLASDAPPSSGSPGSNPTPSSPPSAPSTS
jgi:hypothetical protein